jgi:biopolymer transport protein ExbD
MKSREKFGNWGVSGLRTRYFPKNRIGHGFLIISPWINIVLLLLYLVLLDKHLVVQPGVMLDLPRAPFLEGSAPGMNIVVIAVKPVSGQPAEDIAFFDDVRFRVTQPHRRDALREALREGHIRHDRSSLVIQADQAVSAGTMMLIMNLAQEVGIERVNLATRPL